MLSSALLQFADCLCNPERERCLGHRDVAERGDSGAFQPFRRQAVGSALAANGCPCNASLQLLHDVLPDAQPLAQPLALGWNWLRRRRPCQRKCGTGFKTQPTTSCLWDLLGAVVAWCEQQVMTQASAPHPHRPSVGLRRAARCRSGWRRTCRGRGIGGTCPEPQSRHLWLRHARSRHR